MNTIKTISIDIESFSSVDLVKCGAYKYAESPDFEILLFGYAVNEGEVCVVDIASGEKVPEEIIAALTDDSIEKWAYNSQFERVCLSSWLRRHYPENFYSYSIPEDTVGDYISPYAWKCSRVWGAYMGLPMSLKGIGAVLKLDEQKMDEGAALIRFFCKPCRPTKANGERTRNLPHHAPDKWAIFKEYNKRDVEVELAIKARLAKFPVPDFVWDEYHLDQEINDRGILIDTKLVEQAIAVDTKTKESLLSRMKEITGLDNPNSVAQTKSWLAQRGIETESLDKKAVLELLPDADEDVADALSCRQQLAKSSVSKYAAMQNAVCADGRARGMFQFYGANRTGRWCLTGDHEILTKDGWVRLDAWAGGQIACWNAKSEAVSFQNAEKVSFPYNGKVYTYKDVRIDQCSTPDHKMWAKKRHDASWADMTVEEMSLCRPSIPITEWRQNRGCANLSWLRVLIMTQADGHYTADGSVKFHFKKLRKIERCKHLLRKAEIPFTVSEYKDSTVIAIPARAVPLWLREFRTKTFDFWLLDESPDIIFDELPHWDGYHPTPNSIQYSTCVKQNADIIQALAHMSGKAASIRVKKHSEMKPHWKDAYVVDIWLSPKNCHELRCKPAISDYSGMVYCAVTGTGYFLVRRNGKVWVTGNSGKIVQLQNLPQNHMDDLAEARNLVRDGNYIALEMLYDNIPEVLSELVRTALIPKPGYKYIVADFSAIEARVLSFLAGEKWRIDLFAQGGDIYCQSASKMFGVPVEKNGVNGRLRQKGKIAELACIAEGQLVLTDSGLVPVEKITKKHHLWDGESWVSHDGVIFKGEREVITYEGLTATPDHLVWVEGKQEPIQLGNAAASGAHLIQTGASEDMICDNNQRTARLYDIQNAGPHHRFTVSGKLVHNCGYGGSVGALKAMGALEMGLTEEELKPLVDAWRSANANIVRFWWAVDEAAKACIKERSVTETHGIKFVYRSGMMFIELPSARRLAYVKPRIGENQFGGESISYMGLNAAKKWSRLESYGPKLVENITQAISRDLLCHAMQSLRFMDIVAHVHDEIIIECDSRVSLPAVCEQMARTPAWAKGLLLRADGFECSFYQKD